MLASLRGRILALFLFTIALMLAVTAAAVMVRQDVDASLDDALTQQLRGGVALGQMSRAVTAISLRTTLAVSDLTNQAPDRLRIDQNAHDAAVDQADIARAQYDLMDLSGSSEGRWSTYVERYHAMRAGDKLVWSALTEGDLELAKTREAANERAVQEAESAGEALLDLYDEGRLNSSMHEAQFTSNMLLAAVLLGGAALSLLLVALTTQAFTARLQAMQVGVQRMSTGALDADFSDRTNDEIGLISQKLAEVVAFKRGLAEVAEKIAAGDTDRSVLTRGAEDRFSEAINSMATTLKDTVDRARRIASGDLVDVELRGPKDSVGAAIRAMTAMLRKKADEVATIDWLKSGVAKINEVVLGKEERAALANDTITALAEHLGASVGVLYSLESDPQGPILRLSGSYAFTRRKHLATEFRVGEGLVGQVAGDRRPIVLQQVPDDYVHIVSGLGETSPVELCVVPVLFKGELRGVIELGVLSRLTDIQREFVSQSAMVIGAAFEIVRSKEIVSAQQEELRTNNEELERQKVEMEATAQQLKAQQVELEQTNAEVEAQMRRALSSEERLKLQQAELELSNRTLADRNVELERQKVEIENARRGLAIQAEDLAIASKYKSEFLANMSHELRTPLNSLLLLARSLRDNADGNMLPDQVESAGVIYDSGIDLLNLINEILDLAKIEAGRMELRLEPVDVSEIAHGLTQQFGHMAKSQGLALKVVVEPDADIELTTDPGRLGQVLKNLIGNAIKFTDKGSVEVIFGRQASSRPSASGAPDSLLAIHIVDTGIGIPLDKQKVIFEAFQQADSGDRRRFGGTGLGLTISRNIVSMLGGDITVTSEAGKGSTFTVLIPIVTVEGEQTAPVARRAPTATLEPIAVPSKAPAPTAHVVEDDRASIDERDRIILIVEDDLTFNRVLVSEVRKRGFKCLAAVNGEDGVELAKTFRPSGVILDLHLPGMDGWAVLSTLKQDVDTRHIPVHIVSAEDASLDGLRIGAIGHANKPLTPADITAILARIERSVATAEKHVLVVEDDPIVRRETMRMVGNGNVHVHEAVSGTTALEAMRARAFDLVVLDLGLADMQGLELLEAASAGGAKVPPVIVYTARDLTPYEEMALRQYAETIIIKDVRSNERLVDEVALFLHRVVNDLPADKKSTIRHLHESDEKLRGKTVLIVEDDMRTMFAMAKLLASHGIHPLKAADGSQALAVLETEPVDLVLLDMMMPVMDGYETAARIRAQERFATLPIVALTAKAMKEDRQKCIQAGATDYLTKPVDQDRLLSLLRIWMCR